MEDASHAPNNQPDPINEPNPSYTSCGKLILLLSSFCPIITPNIFSFIFISRISGFYTPSCIWCYYTRITIQVKSTFHYQ